MRRRTYLDKSAGSIRNLDVTGKGLLVLGLEPMLATEYSKSVGLYELSCILS